jgi:SAM-dependent methyltransferase
MTAAAPSNNGNNDYPPIGGLWRCDRPAGVAFREEVLEIVSRNCYRYTMSDAVRRHYEEYPYPLYPLVVSVRRCDTYALNLEALWARFNGSLPPPEAQRILIAGCGTFSPYPFAVANPRVSITALDLSRRSLQRAHLHCLLHGRYNVTYAEGELCDRQAVDGTFGLIDAYGVLHHLDDPLQGLKALAERLAEGGILRIMVYSRYARREEESIRRAFRLLKIQDIKSAKGLIVQARPGSRLSRFAENSSEAAFTSGLADALLHPCVHTFRIDKFLELVDGSGLQPLLFAHADALENVDDEIGRIRRLETNGRSPGNFVLYLGRKAGQSGPDIPDPLLVLNPCLRGSVGRFNLGTLRIIPRLGHPTPPIGYKERRFLRPFLKAVSWKTLSPAVQETADIYVQALFLVRFRP